MENRFPHLKPQDEIDAEERPTTGAVFVLICAVAASISVSTVIVANWLWPF